MEAFPPRLSLVLAVVVVTCSLRKAVSVRSAPQEELVSHDASSFEDLWDKYLNSLPKAELQGTSDSFSKRFFDLDELLARNGGVKYSGYSNVSHTQCEPSLEGPKDSSKLAILVHGFTGCPASWFGPVPGLLAEGFRVMRPLMPGHGLKWHRRNTSVCKAAEKIQNCIEDTESDNLDSFPTDPADYLGFANLLSSFAMKFKSDHPNGMIVIAGHSLGGLLSLKAAIDSPKLFDRVLIANPALGLSAWLLHGAMDVATADLVLSFDDRCAKTRDLVPGGYCQFKVKHLRALRDTAEQIYCNEWSAPCLKPQYLLNSFSKAARWRDSRLKQLRSLHFIVTQHDSAVENPPVRVMENFWQYQRRGALMSHISFLPETATHNWVNAGLAHLDSVPFYWPYMMRLVVDYLAKGIAFPVISNPRMACEHYILPVGPKRYGALHGDRLAFLPWTEKHDGYTLGPNGYAHVLYSGNIDIHGFKLLKWTYSVQLLRFEGKLLLVARSKIDDGTVIEIDAVFLIAPHDEELTVSPKQLASGCMDVPMQQLSSDGDVVPFFERAREDPSAARSRVYSLCKLAPEFWSSMCKEVTCHGAHDVLPL